MITCVYIITTTINAKVYIGSAKNYENRIYEHKKKLKYGTHHSIKLQNHYNKYGPMSLQFNILEECNVNDLIKIEQKWIDYYNAYKTGFNMTPNAGSSLGRILSNDTKNKIRIKALGRKQSDETIAKRVAKNNGKTRSEQATMQTTLKNCKLSDSDITNIKFLLNIGIRQVDIALIYGVCQRSISRIHQGISYQGRGIYGTTG